MHQQRWSERFYIDLQAGPGKNRVGSTVLLGSPLIALTSPHPATQFRFNELDPVNRNALETRVTASPLRDRVVIYQGNVNQVVQEVCQEITDKDRRKPRDKWSTFNITFLDPEGLELHWSTVEALASMKKMDLIINFSTGGIVRSIGRGNDDAVDKFFGTSTWRNVDVDDPVQRRRNLIDFYRQRLEKFGYHIEIDPNLGGDDIAVNNSKNAQVYSLIFASKHELGDKLWKQAAKRVKPPRLPGFD
jgi:three-Cys-motif partner protein